MSAKTPEKSNQPLPSLEELEHIARTAEGRRVEIAKRIGPMARQHTAAEQSKTASSHEVQQFKDKVVRQIKQEASAVAAKLRDAGVQPDISIRSQKINSPSRALKFWDTHPFSTDRTKYRDYYRARGKVKKLGDVDGWLLTPPQETKYNQNAKQNGRHHNPKVMRSGLALGLDGKIYGYYHKGELKEDMVVTSIADVHDVVRPEQFVRTADGITYVDRIADTYSHPALPENYVPRPGEDNTSLIHGLGVREALAALQLRAEPNSGLEPSSRPPQTPAGGGGPSSPEAGGYAFYGHSFHRQ